MSNLPIYLSNYKTFFLEKKGEILSSTAAFIISNKPEKRVLNLTVDSILVPKNQEIYEIIFDFQNIESPYSVGFENRVYGTFQISGKVFDASKYITKKKYAPLVLGIRVKIPCHAKKGKSLSFNININDTDSAEPIPTNGICYVQALSTTASNGNTYLSASNCPSNCSIAVPCLSSQSLSMWAVEDYGEPQSFQLQLYIPGVTGDYLGVQSCFTSCQYISSSNQYDDACDIGKIAYSSACLQSTAEGFNFQEINIETDPSTGSLYYAYGDTVSQPNTYTLYQILSSQFTGYCNCFLVADTGGVSSNSNPTNYPTWMWNNFSNNLNNLTYSFWQFTYTSLNLN